MSSPFITDNKITCILCLISRHSQVQYSCQITVHCKNTTEWRSHKPKGNYSSSKRAKLKKNPLQDTNKIDMDKCYSNIGNYRNLKMIWQFLWFVLPFFFELLVSKLSKQVHLKLNFRDLQFSKFVYTCF